MEMKGALTTANNRGASSYATRRRQGFGGQAASEGKEELKEYFYCGLRKSEPRISVAVCHQKRCLFLESDGGKFRCNYRNYVDERRAAGLERPLARKGGRKNASK